MPTAQSLVQRFNDLKTLPDVAIRVSQMACVDSTTIQDFEEVIKLDPVLVMRLLRLVNSPYFGLASRVESISKAVVFIGIEQLRNLVAVEAIRDLFTDHEPDPPFSRKNLWVHSATVAILCQMISQRIFSRSGDNAFLAGIMHDIGLIVEDQLVGTDLRKVCMAYAEGSEQLCRYEELMIGTNHGRVGRLLCDQWRFPEEVIIAIKMHHDSDAVEPIPSLTAILQLAEFMACKLGYGVVKERLEPLPSYLADHLKGRMTEYRVLLKALPEEMAKAKELYELDGG